METAIDISVKTQTEESTDTSRLIVRYAWGNEEFKTWFITKTRKAFVPKGSRLLMIIGCEPTNSPINISDTYPKVGDVAQDIDGSRIKIKTVDFI